MRGTVIPDPSEFLAVAAVGDAQDILLRGHEGVSDRARIPDRPKSSAVHTGRRKLVALAAVGHRGDSAWVAGERIAKLPVRRGVPSDILQAPASVTIVGRQPP